MLCGAAGVTFWNFAASSGPVAWLASGARVRFARCGFFSNQATRGPLIATTSPVDDALRLQACHFRCNKAPGDVMLEDASSRAGAQGDTQVFEESSEETTAPSAQDVAPGLAPRHAPNAAPPLSVHMGPADAVPPTGTPVPPYLHVMVRRGLRVAGTTREQPGCFGHGMAGFLSLQDADLVAIIRVRRCSTAFLRHPNLSNSNATLWLRCHGCI
jgi:hypothetical protein